LLTYIPQVVFLIPGALLLLPALLTWSRKSLRILLAAPLLFLLLESWRAPGLRQQATTDEASVKVLTYNIHSGSGGVARIAAAIRTEDPEIICLQEARPWLNLSDPMIGLQKALPEWRFTHSSDVAIGVRGGRFERLEIQNYPVPGGHRIALGVTTTLKGRKINIVTTHLATAMYPETLTRNRRGIPAYLTQTALARRIQLQSLRAFLPKFPGPTIVCGDFNTPPRGAEYARLTETLDDTFARTGTGFGWSYPATRPLLRIDYVFTGGGARPLSARVLSWPHSDHLPLLAELALPAPQNSTISRD
jgi:endonuclease/exonuclease/phosphatase (EEP) superfamily protein YafD